jgi:hypothetical protein
VDFPYRQTPIGMQRPRKKYFFRIGKKQNRAYIAVPFYRTKFLYEDESSAYGSRCMLIFFNLFLDEPRDYDELAEDEDANPGGSMDVNMEDAHAILNEDDTEPGNPSSPSAP